MTNNQRIVLLMLHVGLKLPDERWVANTIDELNAHGFVTRELKITDRARVYIDALDKVPLPVQKWIMP